MRASVVCLASWSVAADAALAAVTLAADAALAAATLAVVAALSGGCGTYHLTPADAGAPPDDAAIALDAGGSGDGATPGAPPLGANPHPGGVTFRVWAPHAAHVFVIGDFNAWSASTNELAAETDASGARTGIFSGDIAGAAVGQEYAYALVAADGSSVTRADPRARQLAADGHGVIVDASAYAWHATSFAPAPLDDTVVYELHLGTFVRATPTTIGTWADAATKLDYLAALGVDAVEIMPPVDCATDVTWGYNPSWPFATHNAYGTPDDAKAFIDAAHAHGIAVYIDIVHNHYASKSGLVCWDGDCTDNAYFYTDATRKNTPWGPRPNFSDGNVRAFIADNAVEWLDEYRADGLRWDSTISIRATGWDPTSVAIPDGASLLREINDRVHVLSPPKVQIAEDLQTYDPITQPTSQSGGYGFDTQWDAAFFHPVDDNIITTNDADRSMAAISGAITHAYNGVPTERVVYTEDHDEVANGKSRIPEMISPGDAGSLAARQRSTLGAAIVMTSPGVPMLFMGQEFLENGHFDGTTPLDWSKQTTYSGILSMYTDLIRLRRNSDGHTQGLRGKNVSVFHVNETAKVIAYRRWDQGGPGDDVIVVANFSAKPFSVYDLGLPRAGAWKARFSSNDTKYSADFPGTPTADVATTATARDGFAQMGALQLGPYQVLILSQ
jgi:1,4-alpha-glucan branching enzyme